jgi:hypothetical protein
MLSSIEVLSSKNSTINKELTNSLKSELKNDLLNYQSSIGDSSIKDLSSLIDEVFAKAKSRESLLNLLKQEIFLKSFNSFSLDLKSLFESLKNSEEFKLFANKIDSFMLDIKTIDSNSLKEYLQSSGLLFESSISKELLDSKNLNILNLFISKDSINDLKLQLLQLKSEMLLSGSDDIKDVLKSLDRVLTQIEYTQLLSYADNSLYFKLAAFWDDLEDGYMKFKSLNKERFYCEIELKLKEFNRVKLSIMLYEKDALSISLFCENRDLESLLKITQKELKNSIKSKGLNIIKFDFLPYHTVQEYTHIFDTTDSLSFSVEA